MLDCEKNGLRVIATYFILNFSICVSIFCLYFLLFFSDILIHLSLSCLSLFCLSLFCLFVLLFFFSDIPESTWDDENLLFYFFDLEKLQYTKQPLGHPSARDSGNDFRIPEIVSDNSCFSFNLFSYPHVVRSRFLELTFVSGAD